MMIEALAKTMDVSSNLYFNVTSYFARRERHFIQHGYAEM